MQNRTSMHGNKFNHKTWISYKIVKKSFENASQHSTRHDLLKNEYFDIKIHEPRHVQISDRRLGVKESAEFGCKAVHLTDFARWDEARKKVLPQVTKAWRRTVFGNVEQGIEEGSPEVHLQGPWTNEKDGISTNFTELILIVVQF